MAEAKEVAFAIKSKASRGPSTTNFSPFGDPKGEVETFFLKSPVFLSEVSFTYSSVRRRFTGATDTSRISVL